MDVKNFIHFLDKNPQPYLKTVLVHKIETGREPVSLIPPLIFLLIKRSPICHSDRIENLPEMYELIGTGIYSDLLTYGTDEENTVHNMSYYILPRIWDDGCALVQDDKPPKLTPRAEAMAWDILKRVHGRPPGQLKPNSPVL